MKKEWKILEDENQITEIIKLSNINPVFIFKHSVTCGISAQAKENLEIGWKLLENKCDFYYLDLLRFRSISNEIALKLGVHHQSPQIILVSNEDVVFHTSHHRITPQILAESIINTI